ncbi:MAG: Hsp70 family protein, partial [Pseudonocardiaceae bacterium]
MATNSVLAIDVGTTNTCAVVLLNGSQPQRLKFGNDWRLPSAVFWAETGPIVGVNAERSQRLDPTRFLRCPKREMGHTSVPLGGQQVPVVTVLSTLLSEVRRETAQQLGGFPKKVILTWPVFWAESRQMVFRNAALASGFTTVEYLEEPVAAAIRIGSLAQVQQGKPFAILDFGGGTLDVAVLVRDRSTFRVLASDGADPLGGEDIDDLLYDYAVSRLTDRRAAKHLINPSEPSWRSHAAALRSNCCLAKEQLSEMGWGSIGIPHTGEDIVLKRAEFETLAGETLQRVVGKLAETIAQSDYAPRAVPVYFVGGSSRIAALSRLVHQHLGCPVELIGDPQFVVSEGAALWLRSRLGGEDLRVSWTERATSSARV